MPGSQTVSPLFFSVPAQPENADAGQRDSGYPQDTGYPVEAGYPVDTTQCGLCPQRCVLPPGGEGRCRVRKNRGGRPDIPFYGYVTAIAADPIEKKPLYHYRPGSQIFSIGFAGCNLRCPFCQNWHISQATDSPGRYCSPAGIIAAVEDSAGGGHGTAAVSGSITAARSVAYTYSEPLVHIEFLLDCMREARKAGIANVLVSNGCVNSEAAGEILALTDAANIDLKCFSEDTYAKVLGLKRGLETVTGFISMAVQKNVHVEITTLVVPGLNDSRSELEKCADFIAGLQKPGAAVPWHLSAYHPDYKWRAPATDPQFLIVTAKWAGEKLGYVYTGNIARRTGDANSNDTLCRHCGKTLVGRSGYSVTTTGLSLKEENGKPLYFCAYCGKKAVIIY